MRVPARDSPILSISSRFDEPESTKRTRRAAEAAESAGAQGKFWEFHDTLFENQTEWAPLIDPKGKFEGYAQKLGLDVTKFKSDLTSDTVKAAVAADEEGDADEESQDGEQGIDRAA